MKALVAVCTLILATLAWGADKAAAPPADTTVVKGEVLEVLDVETYSYLRLKTKNGETWAAVLKTPLKKGAQVTIDNTMIMSDFESKALKRTFPKIVFGSLVGAQSGGGDAAMAHAGMAKPAAQAVQPETAVAKASGPNARTVAEVATRSAELKDKPVLVRGRVVKYNGGIMGKNWVHLRDGSGSEADGSNDVLVTTSSEANVGDVVTAKGVVHTDRDLGSGYFYKVLIEEATLQK